MIDVRALEVPDPLADAVATVARWYTARDLPPRAQLPGPPGPADAAFAGASWARGEDVLVLTAAPAAWSAPEVEVRLAPAPDDAWPAGYRYRRRRTAARGAGGADPRSTPAVRLAGRDHGARSCLLQVSEDNAPALALYARLDFTEHHRYHYRSAPA